MSDDTNDMGELFSPEELDALRNAPAAAVVANHLIHLLELAAIHLSGEPANLAEASLVIDAVAAALDATEDRLGEPGEIIGAGLSEIQLAFVRLAGPSANAN